MKIKYKNCSQCRGTGRVHAVQKTEMTKELKRLLKVMNKNNLNQRMLAHILGITQSTVSGWFIKRINPNGKINKKYFEILKNEGLL